MARKPKIPEHVNHERWLVSYADFITLLFAFFVVMFAVSQVDTRKLGRFTESFQEATEFDIFDGSGRGMLSGHDPKTSVPAPATSAGPGNGYGFISVSEKVLVRRALGRRLRQMPELLGLKLVDLQGELVLRLPDRFVFDVGDDKVKRDGQVLLLAIAEELRGRPIRMRVEGHTDAAPIHNARFPSNWELSAGRAMSVLRFLVDTQLIEPARLSAAGYGEHHPVATNDTPEGRSQNRRVDLVIVADAPRPKDARPVGDVPLAPAIGDPFGPPPDPSAAPPQGEAVP